MTRSSSSASNSEDEEELSVMYEEGRMAIMRCHEDDLALRIAAERSRLPFDRPTEHEFGFFPELWDSNSGVQVFLYIRNTTLKLWLENPTDELTIGDVKKDLPAPFNSDAVLIENIHHYLTRTGQINIGRFRRETGIPRMLPDDERKVVVIGAGVAGIAAALQLISFGFDVTIIEARNRIGGRVGTIVENGEIMEIGGDTLRNSRSNPLTVLMQQFDLDPIPIKEHEITFLDGKPVDPHRDRVIGGMYCAYSSNRDALEYITHTKDVKDHNGQYISRQQAFENLLNIVERGILVNYYNYCVSNDELSKKRESHFDAMRNCREVALSAEKRLAEVDPADTIQRRALRRDINCALSKFEHESEQMERCDHLLQNHRKHSSSKQYMHPLDYRNYNFFLAHEEFVYGAPLEKVQFSCEAAKSRMPGASIRIDTGISAILEKLVEHRNMDIRLQHRVTNIDYSGDGVVVRVQKGDSEEIEEISANYCVSTIPIGVMKKTVAGDERAPKFTPSLDEEKVEAIRCIGNGLINKIIMLFDNAFWETNGRNHFSNVSTSVKGRGEMLVWTAVPGSKVMTTYLVGNSADCKLPDNVVVLKAIAVLQGLFPSTCPKAPLKAHVTRYQDDEFSFGTGAFMSLRTETKHFADITKPLKCGDGKQAVYFAGEHTSMEYCGTLQGAWLSGLRVAADMANDIYGISYVHHDDDADMIDVEEEHTLNGTTNGENGTTNGENGTSRQEENGENDRFVDELMDEHENDEDSSIEILS